MKVSGFSFIRNAVKYDYPIVEAINSVLPLCDEFVIAVGNSDDKTLEMIKAIKSPKLRIIETVWDDSLREGGRVLALETDKAFKAISKDSDWAFYIQGDEVMHEKYLDKVKQAMLKYKDEPSVEGLLFGYQHFYGSYDFIGTSYRWYRNEIRVVRNLSTIFSYRDAQGFRKKPNNKLSVKKIDAEIYHYGWVKPPEAMQKKTESFHKMWHDDEWIDKNIAKVEAFDYSNIDGLKRFEGTHPKVMIPRVQQKNWQFDFDPSFNASSMKDRVKRWVETVTGWRIGEYKNYKLL